MTRHVPTWFKNPFIERVHALLDEIECPPYEFVVEPLGQLHDFAVLRARLWRKDIDSNEEGWGYNGPYLIASEMSDDTLIKKCFVAARDYAEHEVREAFTYRGKRILGPHTPIDGLVGVALDG